MPLVVMVGEHETLGKVSEMKVWLNFDKIFSIFVFKKTEAEVANLVMRKAEIVLQLFCSLVLCFCLYS